MIMVVDDDTVILRLVEFVLRRLPFRVITIEDPQKAAQMLESVTPDLFILDLMMPHMNGIELCRYIRSLPATASTPVIILSAYYDHHVVRQGLQAGATLYLPKSELHRGLISHVRSLLNMANVP